MPVRSEIAVTRHAACDEPARSRARSTHEFAVLAYFTGGRSRVQQESDLELTLTEGDVLLVPPGMPHRTVEARRPVFWGLSVPFSSLATHDERLLLEPFERVRDGATAAARIPADRREHLDRLFRELEKAGSEAALPAVQKSLAILILDEVARACGPRVTAIPPRRRFVIDALRHIERHALEPLTLQDVAASVGRSPAHVTNVLKRETGRSVGEWIVSARMAEARRLLLHSDERIDAVAERVGYADVTHFIRMFRRAHGSTPAAWRAASRSD